MHRALYADRAASCCRRRRSVSRYELSVIERMGFSDYFLIVWDFIRYAHEQGIRTGPGRGSSAGSLVAYSLRITDVDPIKHKLLFEEVPQSRADQHAGYRHRLQRRASR